MEAELLHAFYARLVPLVGECFQSIADQCLSHGLIQSAMYKEMLYSSESNENKARKLMLAIETATNSDNECCDLFMSILEGEFAIAKSGKALLQELKEKLTEQRTSEGGTKAVIPFYNQDPSQYVALLTKEFAQQGKSLFGKLEEAIRELESARISRSQLEKDVESKTHEVEELRQKLKQKDSQRDKTESRISDCESEISRMKERMDELETIIEEQGMRVKRNKSFASMELDDKAKQFVDIFKHEAEHLKKALREKEEQLVQAKRDHRTKLKGKENELNQLKEHNKKQAEEMKDLKHRVELQEKDLKIKDLELEHMGKTEDDDDDDNNNDESESDSSSDGDYGYNGDDDNIHDLDSDDDDLSHKHKRRKHY